jgi:quinol monooxygenase YgiN
MIYEIAILKVDPARAEAFERDLQAAPAIFATSPDCLSFALDRVIERPGEYRLVVGWTSVEAHMVAFRESPAFQQWRAIAGPYFVAPPEVCHTARAIGR